MPANVHEPVVRDADERRREHGDERLVVVAVVQQAQVREQVDDLLLAEVPAAGRAVGRQVVRPQRRLVALGVGAGGEEQHDLARRRDAVVDELAHAARDRPRLAVAPALPRLAVAALVADEQLDRMAEHRVGELTRGGERLVAVAELLAEEMVDRGEHLGPRAVVPARAAAAAPRARGARGRPRRRRAGSRRSTGTRRRRRTRPAGARAVPEQVDDVALQPVRVLELVDHDRAEAQLLGLADLGVVAQQVAGVELQVLEVERRLARLRGGVLGGEEIEQLLQQLAVARGQLVERRLVEPVARAAELGRAIAGRGEMREVEQLLRVRAERERRVRRGELLVGHVGIGGQRLRRGVQVGEALGDAGLVAELELQVAPRRAERLVDAGEHAAQPLRAVGREQAQPLGVARRAETGERALERLAADHGAVLVVELAEARVDPHRERMRAQQPRAEPVDRRDPRAVELAREVVTAARVQRRADARAQLAGRLAGVGDHEHRLDVEPLLADGADEALDEHRRLARCRRRPRRRPRPSPRPPLSARGSRQGRSTRHIVQRSHQVGHVPPFGSWRTSPARMRCA